MRLWLYPFGSRARNQGCMNPPSLRVPAQESEGGPPRNPGNYWPLPPQRSCLPTPYSCLGQTSPPSPASQIPAGNLVWRQCSVLDGCLGRAEPVGVGAGVGMGEERGSELTPLEEAPAGLSFPKRMNPFRARKEGEKTLSGI